MDDERKNYKQATYCGPTDRVYSPARPWVSETQGVTWKQDSKSGEVGLGCVFYPPRADPPVRGTRDCGDQTGFWMLVLDRYDSDGLEFML